MKTLNPWPVKNNVFHQNHWPMNMKDQTAQICYSNTTLSLKNLNVTTNTWIYYFANINTYEEDA
jgi:hypothetical protein